MLPNLGELRLTTSEPYEITRDDERRNGGPFKDPITMNDLPVHNDFQTFRVKRNDGSGYDWHNSYSLAAWVKQQIVERKSPVTDPYGNVMSKMDVNELRWNVDRQMPPYDPDAVYAPPKMKGRVDPLRRPPVHATFEFERLPGRSDRFGISLEMDVEEDSIMEPFAEYFSPGGKTVMSQTELITMHDLPLYTIEQEMQALREMALKETRRTEQLPKIERPPGSEQRLAEAMCDLGARHIGNVFRRNMPHDQTTIQFSSGIHQAKHSEFPGMRLGKAVVLHWEIANAPSEFLEQIGNGTRNRSHNEAYHDLRIVTLTMLDYLLRNIHMKLYLEPSAKSLDYEERDKPVPGGVAVAPRGPDQPIQVRESYRLKIMDDYTITRKSNDALHERASRLLFVGGERQYQPWLTMQYSS
jgi:hypothetical protein